MLNEIATLFLQLATPIATPFLLIATPIAIHGTNLFIAVKLHLSMSESNQSTQRALIEHSGDNQIEIREQYESNQSIKIRVTPVGA